MYYTRKGCSLFKTYRAYAGFPNAPFPSWFHALVQGGYVKVHDDCLEVRTYTGNWRRVGLGKVILLTGVCDLWEMTEEAFKENFDELDA